MSEEGENKLCRRPTDDTQKRYQNYVNQSQVIYGDFFTGMRQSWDNIANAQKALADIDKELEENLEKLKRSEQIQFSVV